MATTAVDSLSGLRLKQPRQLPADEVAEQLRGYRFHKLDALRSVSSEALASSDPLNSWATVGVLVRKAPTKQGANGRPYARWGLSTLSLGCKEATLLLSKDALTSHELTPPGSVLLVLGARGLPRDGSGSGGGGDGVAFAVEAAWQLSRMGQCADYALCSGIKANGEHCTMAVNKSTGPYCIYHVSKRTGAGPSRPGTGAANAKGAGFQAATRAPGSSSFSHSSSGGGACRVLQRQGAGVQHGPLGCSVRRSGALQPQRSPQRAVAAATAGAAQRSSLTSHPPVKNALLAMGGGRPPQQPPPRQQHAFGGAKGGGGGGAEALVAQLANARGGGLLLSSGGRASAQQRPFVLERKRPSAQQQVVVSSGDVLGDLLSSSSSDSKKAPVGGGSAGGSGGAKQAGVGGEERMDGRVPVPKQSALFTAARRAPAVGSHGGPQHAMSRELQAQMLEKEMLGAQAALAEKIRQRASAPAGLSSKRPLPQGLRPRNSAPPVTSALAKRIKGMTAEELQKLETTASKYADGAAQIAAQQMDAQLDRLEARDAAIAQLEAVQELSVKAFKCVMCGTMNERRRCPVGERHLRSLQAVSVTKRFWQCQRCSRRTHTLGRQLCPAEHCAQCGADTWKRCGAYLGKTADPGREAMRTALSEDTDTVRNGGKAAGRGGGSGDVFHGDHGEE